MEEKPNIWKHSLYSGLIIGLALIVYSLILFLTNSYMNRGLNTWAAFLILIGGIVWTHQQFKKQGDGTMKYSEGLGLGTLVSGISAAINGIFGFLYMYLIDTSIMQQMDRMMEEQRVQMQDQGMSEAQVEQAMKIAEFFQQPLIMYFTILIFYLFMGFIFSLLISIFTKKEGAAVV